MRHFELELDFTDVAAEREVIAAFVRNPGLYQEFRDSFPDGIFCHHDDAWKRLLHAIKNRQEMPLFEAWEPTLNLEVAVQHLADLFVKRVVAGAVQEVVERLYQPESSAQALLTQLNSSFTAAQAKAQIPPIPKRLIWATDILVEVLTDAERRGRERKEIGKPVLGTLTGIDTLDAKLGGLNRGLYILAGPPGMGKTSLALQLSTTVAREIPAIYVTFENPARNLAVKALCERSGIDTQDVSRGTADL